MAKSKAPGAPDKRPRAGRPRPPDLSPDASDRRRQQLIAELEQIENADALAAWAQRALPLKGQLTVSDARAVEAALAARVADLGDTTPVSASKDGHEPHPGDHDSKHVIVISKPVRERDRNHLRFVASQPCLGCGRAPSDAHHLKFAEQRAMGRKVSDRFTVPICRLHHRELHRRGDERLWWENQGLDPLPIAAGLWEETHAVDPVAELAGDMTGSAKLNGQQVVNGIGVSHQNDETNPIRQPGAR